MKKLRKKLYLMQLTFTLFTFIVGLFVHFPAVAQEETTVTYTAIEDTYVYANKATTNYGSSNPLYAKYHADDTKTVYRAAYIKFAVPDINLSDSVTLRIYGKINDSNATAQSTQTCYIATADSNWDASTMTYETRSSVQANIADFIISGTSYQEYTVNVTNAVREAASQGKEEITFVYLGGTSYITNLYSCEASAQAKRPTLVVKDTSVTYTAIEDTYIHANNATTNYGSSNPLYAKYHADDTKTVYRVAYIKFAVPENLSGKAIKLRVYAKINDSNATAESTQTCYIATADSNWDASTMTYETRPVVQANIADFVVSGTSYQEYTVDVTHAVREAASQGEEEITFVYLGGTSYITNLYSCEATNETKRPSLVVEDLVPQTSRSMEPYETIADTYVDGRNQERLHGSYEELRAKNVSNSYRRTAYFKFSIPQLQASDTIALRLALKITDSNATTGNEALSCVLATADSNWDESTMLYTDAPTPSDAIATFTVSGTAYQAYTIDVTETVQAYAERGETEITFAYLGGSEYITTAYSKEAGVEGYEYRPYLVVSKGNVTFLNEDDSVLKGIKVNSAITCRLNEDMPGEKVVFASYNKQELVSVDVDDATEGTELTVTTGDSVIDQSLRVYIWNEELLPLVSVIEFYNPFSLDTALLTTLGIPGESALVQETEEGNLVYYPYTEKGDILPDFSGVGYMGGSAEFPTSTVVENVSPVDGDDTATIQAAIDTVSALSADENGIRGVVLLEDGEYEVSGTLTISTSGIILRGESRNGTIIRATGTSAQESVVSVCGPASITESETEFEIDADYVPVGAKVLPLETTAGLAVGDDIVIVRPPSEQWIADIGMDANGIFAGTSANPWVAATYEFHFERKIVAIEGNNITIDHPIVMSMDAIYGGGQIRKVLSSGRISQVGIESLTFESEFDETVVEDSVCVDENHANRAVLFSNAENCWAQNLTAKYFINECVDIATTAKYVTVTDCSATDFVSKIEGSRRYGFEINGQMSLVKNCVTDNARHAFVQGSRVCGPNVFYNCTSTNDHSTSEPHHRWAMGTLFDNITASQGMQAVQRGDYGSGHGWAGANIIFWNCAAPHIGVMQPPTAQNFAIGVSAVPASGTEDIAKEWVRSINTRAKEAFLYTGYPFAGDGYMELPDRPAKITSLYLAQQGERMN